MRRQLNGIMRECLERGADGACLCFARGFPLVRYEQPVLDRYRERYGGDARELDDRDERLRSVWAEITTEWIREIRGSCWTSLARRRGTNGASWR